MTKEHEQDRAFLWHALWKWGMRFHSGGSLDTRTLSNLKLHYLRTYGLEAHDEIVREVDLAVARDLMSRIPARVIVFTPKRVQRREKRGRYVANWR